MDLDADVYFILEAALTVRICDGALESVLRVMAP